jgi:hypothetical protein
MACQSKTSNNPPAGSASGGASTTPAKPKTTLEITLPPLSGKPPVKTAPLDKPALTRLAAIRFPEFSAEVTDYPTSVAIRQRASLRPRMSVNVAISPCNDKLKCTPMTVEAWREEEATLKAAVDPALVNRPDSTFEIGATTIGGAPAIYVYQAGQYFGKDERGNPVGSYSHAYTMHYNDGLNLLRVTVSFADDPRDTLDDMKRALPREFLERVATSFLDAYGQAWASSP